MKTSFWSYGSTEQGVKYSIYSQFKYQLINSFNNYIIFVLSLSILLIVTGYLSLIFFGLGSGSFAAAKVAATVSIVNFSSAKSFLLATCLKRALLIQI